MSEWASWLRQAEDAWYTATPRRREDSLAILRGDAYAIEFDVSEEIRPESPVAEEEVNKDE